ncbi:hypothetical protein H4R19_000188 [Coemansia spiralis]|nr:hypothetical protein H4R19_000188 [Coemansia spiralis]
MRTGVKMQKLSQQVKGCLDGLKRRRRSGFSSDGSSQRSSTEMEIIHVSMEESRRLTRPPEAVAAMAPMNYWVTSDNESSIYSECPSREPSYVDILDRAVSSTEFTPLRSAPKPTAKLTAKPATKPTARPMTKVPRLVTITEAPKVMAERHFARDEWEERADEAVFGSHSKPRQLDNEPSSESEDGSSTAVDSVVPRAARQLSGISVRAGQSPQVLCSTALSDLLFTTNAQIDSYLHDMMEDYVNGRVLTNLTDDFEAVVEHSYTGFLKAAQPILDITSETTKKPATRSSGSAPALRRYPSARYAGSMESLLSEIVDCYITQTEDTQHAAGAGWQGSCRRASPRQSVEAEGQMATLGIDIVKYTYDQLRRYAATSISKYVSSQVLISTGIENDLTDRLDEAAEALRMSRQQQSTIEALHGDKEGMSRNIDIAALRKKNIRLKRTVRQLRDDARDASNIRRIFEMALLEIQLL